MADDDIDPRFLPGGSGAQFDQKDYATVPDGSSSSGLTVDSSQPPPILSTSFASILNDPKQWAIDQATGVGRGVRDVVKGAVGGAFDTAALPLRAAGLVSSKTPTVSDYLDRAMTAIGLPQDTTPADQLRSTVIQGAASTLPYMAAGGVPALADAYPVIASRLGASTGGGLVTQAAQGGAGALGGDLTAKALPDWTPDYARAALSLLGNMAAATAVHGAATGVGRVGNIAVGKTNEVYDSLKRLGINTNLVGTVSEDPTAQLIEATAGKSGLGASILQPEMRRVVGQFGDAVQDFAGDYGPQTNATAAGTVLQNSAHDWINNVFPNQIEKPAWDPVHEALQGTQVSPTNYRMNLENIVNPPGSLPNAQRSFVPSGPAEWLENLNADVPAGSNSGGTMSWENAKQLRTSIGKAMGTPELVQSVGMDNLKNAYAGIASDMRDTAVDNGAGDLFDNANAVSTNGHSFIHNVLRNVVRANNPAQESITPTDAVNSVLGGDSSGLRAIRENMPDAADASAAYQLRHMALATPGQSGATGAETSTNSFLTRLNQMRQNVPDGTAALFNTDQNPMADQRLQDLANAAAALRETARKANTSGTSSATQLLMGLPLAGLGFWHGGIPEAATLAGLPMAGNAIMATAARNPWLARLMATPKPELPSGLLGAAGAYTAGQRQSGLLQPGS